MIGVLLLVLAVPAALVIGGIVAFVMLPVKAGVAVAVVAFIAAGLFFSWAISNLDFSH